MRMIVRTRSGISRVERKGGCSRRCYRSDVCVLLPVTSPLPSVQKATLEQMMRESDNPEGAARDELIERNATHNHSQRRSIADYDVATQATVQQWTERTTRWAGDLTHRQAGAVRLLQV